MLLDTLTSNSEWTKRKLDLIRQHHADWQRCFGAENESWHSLQQEHRRQRRELRGDPVDIVNWKHLIQQQLEEIQQWRRRMASYRLALQTRQGEESDSLETEKRALSGHFSD